MTSAGIDNETAATGRVRRASPFAIAVCGLTLLTFILSLGFPRVSDDFCHLVSSSSRGLWGAAANSYRTWTARSGELLMLATGRHLDGVLFDVLNALVMAGLLMLGFWLIVGRRGQTVGDAVTIVALYTLVSISTAFGAAFLWRSGSLNYAWSLLLIVAHFLLYRLRASGRTTAYDRAGMSVVAGFTILSFAAGMGSFDLGALGVMIHLTLFVSQWRKGRTLAVRYAIPAVAYIAGFATLYFAPGTTVRAEGIPSYRSVGSLLESTVSGELVAVLRHVLLVLGWSAEQTNYLVLVAAAVIVVAVIRDRLRTAQAELLWRSMGAVVLVAAGLAAVAASEGGLDRWQVMGVALVAAVAFAIASLTDPPPKDASPERAINQRDLRVLLGLFVILFLDVVSFTVGILPAQRTYLPATVLAAAIVVLALRPLFSKRPVAVVVGVAFALSFAVVSLQVAAERDNAQRLEQAVADVDRAAGLPSDLTIASSYSLDLPQFADWTTLSPDPNFWANRCAATHYGVDSVRLVEPHRKLGLTDFTDELRR